MVKGEGIKQLDKGRVNVLFMQNSKISTSINRKSWFRSFKILQQVKVFLSQGIAFEYLNNFSCGFSSGILAHVIDRCIGFGVSVCVVRVGGGGGGGKGF